MVDDIHRPSDDHGAFEVRWSPKHDVRRLYGTLDRGVLGDWYIVIRNGHKVGEATIDWGLGASWVCAGGSNGVPIRDILTPIDDIARRLLDEAIEKQAAFQAECDAHTAHVERLKRSGVLT